MTYQLSRLRLASVGDRAARFTDLTLDVSSPGADGTGAPVDSILWLRNGGGKSSLLSLFFALLLPLRKDFMGRSVKRHLEDYVASGDTSHTVGEWVAQSDGGLLPAARLVTGTVYEWVERRKPVDPDRDRDKLKCWYYTFFAVPGVLDLDCLPVHDDQGDVRTMSDFLRSLRDIAASRPQQLSFALTDHRGQWMETLTARNLDPVLFRYQKQMNHSEGGVAELFNFPSTDKFIDFLVDLTVDSEQPELIAANLRKVVHVVGRKPALLVDRDFCAEMAVKLDVLADEHGRAVDADRDAADAKRAAALLAGAFRSAAIAQETDQRWFAAEADRLRGEALRVDRDRNRVNDVANELLRVAAAHRHVAAGESRDVAKAVAVRARNDNLAWEAVGPLADRVEAGQRADSVRRLMEEQEQESAPLRARRDDAAVVLKARYAELAAVERASEEEWEETASGALLDAEAQDDHQRAQRELAAKAEVRGDNARGDVEKIEKAVDAAVERGDLPAVDAVPAVVLGESQAAKREKNLLLDQVRTRRKARPAQRAQLAERRIALATGRATKIGERDQLLADLGRLAKRVEDLETDPRLAELVQLEAGARLDLWAEAANLRTSLAREVLAAELSVVDAKVDAADDDRALEGLRADAFLPTTRDAQRAVRTIAEAGVVARPGWELLRDLVPESERRGVLGNAAVAELAAGVVVADADAARARLVVESCDWSAVAHVAVSTATQMERALRATAPEWLAVPSDPALFDPLAAESAQVERESRRQAQELLIADLHARAGSDRALQAAVDSVLSDCPAGHLDGLEAAIAALQGAIEDSETEEGTLRDRLDELERDDAGDAGAEQQLVRDLAELDRKIHRLNDVVDKVSGLPDLVRAVKLFEQDVRSCTEFAEQAAGRARDYRQAEQAARSRAAGHKANRERYEREDLEVSVLGVAREVQAGEGETLSVLRSRYLDLDAEWKAVAAQSVLAERLAGFISQGKHAEKALADYSADIVERASALLESGDGQDPDRRAGARFRSREEADRAQQSLTEVEAELVQAEEELVSRTPRDRLRHAQLDVEPANESEARELAAVQAARATEMSGRATVLNREAEDAAKAAGEANTAAQVFGQRAHRLGDAAAPVVVPVGAAAYDGGGEQAEVDTQAVLDRLAENTSAASAARRLADDATQAVRRLAAENRFSGIPDAIRDRFTGDDPVVLAERAAARAVEMRVRRTTIDDQLADIGRDQRLVVVEIAALVQEVLATLLSAHRHSRLPGTLGGWGGEHFLRITFVRPGSDEDLHARIDAVVERIVAENSKPEGLTLLKRCVHEAVAPRGFTVKVLKPNSDLAVEPVDVTHLGKFSGGEKLTVCVALYCTLARLRAVNRGRGKAALGGTLVLDNPLGTASHVALLRLQRDVAAAHGVQLVYTTGVEDLGAVGQFPNVLRLRNAPGALRTRRYVVVDEGFEAPREGITSVLVVRDETVNGAGA